LGGRARRRLQRAALRQVQLAENDLRAQLERAVGELFVVGARHHDHRRVGRAFAQALEEVEAAAAGHDQIGGDDVGALRLDALERTRDGWNSRRRVTPFLEQDRHEDAACKVVVDDEHTRSPIGRC
jgi:hypothetical protein